MKHLSLVLICLVLLICQANHAGDLNPSDPPGSTMKTLDEVEARTPIPGSSGGAGTFVISQSGSYYLTGDRYATGTYGIRVDIDNVTIDLNGYALKGSTRATSGVHMNGRKNVEIRNGTIRNFSSYGVNDGSIGCRDIRLIDLRIINNGSSGVHFAGARSLVQRCTIVDNGYRGAYLGAEAIVTGCTVKDNADYGLHINGSNSVVTGNIILSNDKSGIYTGSHATVQSNSVSFNDEGGIRTGYGCLVMGNSVCKNNQAEIADDGGIRVMGDSYVKDNTVAGNKVNNIYVYAYDNVIEGNLITDSNPGIGIYFEDIGNLYLNNRLSGNGVHTSGATATDGGGNIAF